MKKYIVSIGLVCLMALGLFSHNVFAEEQNSVAKRTVLLYCCGSNLETYSGLATYNLHQVMRASFSQNDDVRFIVLTGGADEWQMESENLYDPEDPDGEIDEISSEYNQIWEVKGADAPENAGKMILVDRDGLTGDGDEAVTSRNELLSDPETLKKFINFGVENYPAEKYDLILWDHGGGPTGGFGYDDHDPSYYNSMSFSEMYDAFSDNELIKNGGKFDFIDFDACLMNTVEYNLAFSDFMDYYIASPETEPGYGQSYQGWLDLVGENPEISTYEVGKKIVDDFIAFYEESGDGYGDSGTLAIVDTSRLLSSDFVNNIYSISQSLVDEAIQTSYNDEILFYDELRSVKGTIQYGDDCFYDLGPLVAQLAVRVDEISVEDVMEEGDMEYQIINSSTHRIPAKSILSILGDEEIIYSRGTNDIHTGDIVYKDSDEVLHYGSLGTSGMYIYFPTVSDYEYTIDYIKEMDNVISKMPADDSRTQTLDEYLRVVSAYSVISGMAQTIDGLIEDGYSKDEIDFDLIYNTWVGDSGDINNYNEWDEYYRTYAERSYGDYTPWLNLLSRQQTKEAIDKDNIEVSSVDRDFGKGFKVVIKDTRQRVVESVDRKVSVELPVADDYIKSNPDLSRYADKINLDLSIGTINGNREIDYDYSIQSPIEFTKDYIRKKNGTESVWDIDAVENKWYAITDSEGKVHAAAIEDDGDGYIYVPATYDREITDGSGNIETIKENVYLEFYNGKVSRIYFRVAGSYRPVNPSELVDDVEYELMPIKMLSVSYRRYYIPISKSTIKLSKNTVDSISLDMMKLKDIPDVGDKDGDGKEINNKIVIKNIYGTEIDISDLAADTEDNLTDIELAWIKPGIYSGEELVPEVVCCGEALIEGQDYELYKAFDDDVFKEQGEYFVLLKGKGKYTGELNTTFNIVKSEDYASKLIEILEEYIEKAQTIIDNLSDDASAKEVEKAYKSLSNTQAMLVQAKEEYQKSLDKKNKELDDKNKALEEKQKKLEEELKKAEKQIEELNEKLSKATKLANTLSVKGKTVKVKYSKVKKKNVSVASKKVVTVNNPQGTVTYEKLKGNKKIKVNKKTGKLTVKKGLKKGTYKVKINVKAAGNDKYAEASKTVTIKVRIK